MLDIKFIREHADIVKRGAEKKKISVDIDRLLVVDGMRLSLLSEVEGLRAEQHRASGRILQVTDNASRAELIKGMQHHKEELRKKEEELKPVMEEWRALMLQVPNVPDMTVPDGASDADNVEVKTWGEKPVFDFVPQTHIDIMLAHKMVDFDRGTKVAGFRGYFLIGDGARLSWAIWNYAQQFFLQKGFDPMIVPSLVRKENFVGTGHLPNEAEDLYKTQDDDYLAGTAEVATMGFHSGEVLKKSDLPKKYLSFSPCFRREAGSHGKDTRGLIRVHEFYKLEQVIICEANHQTSVEYHEWLNTNTEAFIESLGIPYHTVLNCGADLGMGQVKKYDIELWVPLEEKYREISSASYFHDFQTRRFNIRYTEDDGRHVFAHSLNCTAIPTPRILVSLIENFQQKDGSIRIPPVLVPFMGKDCIGR